MQGLLVGLGTALLQAATALVVVGWVWSIMYVSLEQGKDEADFFTKSFILTNHYLYINIYLVLIS